MKVLLRRHIWLKAQYVKFMFLVANLCAWCWDYEIIPGALYGFRKEKEKRFWQQIREFPQSSWMLILFSVSVCQQDTWYLSGFRRLGNSYYAHEKIQQPSYLGKSVKWMVVLLVGKDSLNDSQVDFFIWPSECPTCTFRCKYPQTSFQARTVPVIGSVQKLRPLF